MQGSPEEAARSHQRRDALVGDTRVSASTSGPTKGIRQTGRPRKGNVGRTHHVPLAQHSPEQPSVCGLENASVRVRQGVEDGMHNCWDSIRRNQTRDRFLKAHSFRLSDVRIGTLYRDGTEQWVDPITWRDGEARTHPVPMMVTLAVMSVKNNQNGNRPQLQTAVAGTCQM